MTERNAPADHDAASGLPLPIDPGATDLGDDATDDANRSSSVEDASSHSGIDQGSGLPISIEPGGVDLGLDATRGADEG